MLSHFLMLPAQSQIPIDAINTVAFQSGLLRISCVAAGPNNEARSSGILLISCSQVGQILGSLRRAVEQLDEKVRDQTNPGPEERTAN